MRPVYTSFQPKPAPSEKPMEPKEPQNPFWPPLPDSHQEIGRLLISCPDQPGIVAAVSRFLFDRGANIIHSDQHSTDPTGGTFFMRVEFKLAELEKKGTELEEGFGPVAARFGMQWRLAYAGRVKRLAIFVSKAEHALFELLWRRRAGDLRAEIVMVISNHPDLQETVSRWGIPFHHLSIDPNQKREVEERQIALMEGRVDTVVLARYMQIVTADFIRHY